MGTERKRRILFVGEASFLSTGFGNYYHEVLKRLHATGEFLLGELGGYAHDDDPRCQQVPWKFYPVAPARSDQAAMQKYMPHPGHENQFGKWRFGDTCLDFKPDIVCVPPSTLIRGPGLAMPISDIKVGDKVITHKGRERKVLDVMRRHHVGDMIKISLFGKTEQYYLTPEHPVFAIRPDQNRRHIVDNAEFISAGDLTEDDCVLYPIHNLKDEGSIYHKMPELRTAYYRGYVEKGYLVFSIKKIERGRYDGEVYNLSVEEDESYVTGFAVHNCDIRDHWMSSFISLSPLRNNWQTILMPTIDGNPQRELWLDTYAQADAILTYSDYGMNLLKKTGRPGTNLITMASPGVDLDVFKPPENKREHKAKLGIDPNSLIIGTVMRNQKRKLYYDLIEAFSMWLQRSKSKGHLELAKRTFLYLHTSYPDVGYDIGKAILDFKVGNKVIMTYLCGNCQAVYPSFFAGAIATCRKCGQLAAHPPNANHSCPRNVLADIMKTFDLYVQYSICLHPETPIMTSDGWENIGDINVGDKVVGKDGKLHRVYKTMKNQPDQCFEVSVKCRPWNITATDNHPWLVVGRKGLKLGIESIVNREREHKRRETKCPELKFVYKRTDELKPGDLLVNHVSIEEILPDYDLPFMDEDMAYYIGLFAADGHANESCGQCAISSHSSESISVLSTSQKIAPKIGKDAKQYKVKGRNAVSTLICDTKLRNIIRNICYHEDRSKQLPMGCHLWPKKLQSALVRGLIYGDGHQKDEWVNVYGTTSIHIAKMLCPILERLGWYYCCFIQYRENRLPMYRFEIRIDGKRKSHETLYKDGFVLVKVKDTILSDFNNEVVNIDVEDDHNYVTLQGLQHNCEGYGMPCVDAISCGVPVAAVDYSAMQDHLQCPTSIPIKVGRFFWEAIIETEQRRALPDNQDFVNKLDRFLKQSESQREEKSKQTRDYAEELVETYGQSNLMPRYSWDRTAAIWAQVLREIPIKDPKTTWLCPTSRIHNPNLVPPSNDMSNSEFVNWVIGKIWNRPDMLRTHYANDWLQCLNSGSRTMGDQRVPFTRKNLVEHFMEMVHQGNLTEEKRMALLSAHNTPNQVRVTVL